MKHFSILFLGLILCNTAFSENLYSFQEEDTLWTNGGNLNFNIQQVGFNNWANGGESSTTFGTVLDYSANYKDDKQTWKNTFQGAYGLLKRKDISSRKNTDLLIITSEYGKNLNDKLQVAAAIDLRSQFTNGYQYTEDPNTGDEIETLVSSFFSPGYVLSTLGLSYKEGNVFSATLSPISNKLTIVSHPDLSAIGAYGVTPGEKLRSQGGITVNANYQKEIMENITLKSNLLLFGDYKTLGLWDVNFDLFLDLKVNKFITTNFLIQAIYDHDIKGNSDDNTVTGPALQLRNVLNIGLTFKL